MPQMGVSVSEGTVVEWKKDVGDAVEADEIIASISTDKIDTDIEAPAAGVLEEILVDVGATVDVGTVLARIGTGAAAATTTNGDRPRRYSPVVQRIAAEHGIDLERVAGTGRGGHVRKQDVLALVGEAPAAEAPLHIESPYKPEPEPAPAPAAPAPTG